MTVISLKRAKSLATWMSFAFPLKPNLSNNSQSCWRWNNNNFEIPICSRRINSKILFFFKRPSAEIKGITYYPLTQEYRKAINHKLPVEFCFTNTKSILVSNESRSSIKRDNCSSSFRRSKMNSLLKQLLWSRLISLFWIIAMQMLNKRLER